MPHCLLEYSINLVEEKEFSNLFEQLHQLLTSDNLFNIEDIKSRAIGYDNFFVGGGAKQKSFIALTLSILEGRDIEIKKKLSRDCLDFLKSEFSESINKQNCNITVRISEIEKDSYSRFKNI